jgi:ABC-type multidrug transport system ATPase subunit
MDVTLSHPGVAARHALLFRTALGLRLRDLSGGRTCVNGRPITDTVLNEGDRVEFGPLLFSVEKGRLRRRQRAAGFRLAVEGVTIDHRGRHGLRRLLDGVHLVIEPGEFVGLLGPSGAGKSTLLRCLVGYVAATGGRIRADDLDLPAQAAVYWSQVGYVPQTDVLFPTLTARENLDYSLRLRVPDVTGEERHALIEGRLRQLGLAERADAPVGDLSGGERKRVNVALELLTEPRALFLDEPTAGLDPANETALMRELRQLAESGITVVCATHVLENVCLFDRAVLLAGGRLAYRDRPAGLLPHFGVRTYAELYDPKRLAGRTLPLANPAPAPAPLPMQERAARPPALRLDRQITVQAARGLRLMLRDRGWARLLVAQPILIGLVINLSQVSFYRTSTVFTFAAVAAVWLGLNNTARELVRERRHYVRERLLGVTPAGHLLAKFLLFAAIGLGQVTLLTVVVLYLSFADETRRRLLAAWPLAGVVAALWGAYLGAALLGLAVSALARTQEWAVAALPLIVLPQLLLTGEAASMEEDGRFHSVAYLVNQAGQQEPRQPAEWVLELSAIPTYTRPCVALLKAPPPLQADARGRPPSPAVARLVDVAHLVVLFLLSAVALATAFLTQERRWLRSLG